MKIGRKKYSDGEKIYYCPVCRDVYNSSAIESELYCDVCHTRLLGTEIKKNEWVNLQAIEKNIIIKEVQKKREEASRLNTIEDKRKQFAKVDNSIQMKNEEYSFEEINFQKTNINMHEEDKLISTTWTKCYAVLIQVVGGICCITIIGCIWGIPMILVGKRLKTALEHAKYFENSNSVEKGKASINSFLLAFKGMMIVITIFLSIYILILLISLIGFVGEIIIR